MPNEMTPIEIAEYLEYQLNHTICMLDEDRDALEQAAKYMRKIANGELRQAIHAHWIDYMADKKDWLRDDGKSVFIECSACHEKLCRNLMFSEKYCPACGAAMNGKDDNHETD